MKTPLAMSPGRTRTGPPAAQTLRDFIVRLEKSGQLKRITAPVDPNLEITEVCDRVLRGNGPALLFERPAGHTMPVLANLFGTRERIALAMGRGSVSELQDLGELLAALREPEPPARFSDLLNRLGLLGHLLRTPSREQADPPCQTQVLSGDEVDLTSLPILTCWPDDAGPLLTWGLVITQGPDKERHNLGVYRQQLIGRNRLIMRWLPHRGGALDFRAWCQSHPGKRFPVAVAIGADPATLLAATTPVPDRISEYAFAGLIRGARTQVARCISNPLKIPAQSEIVLEGYIEPGDTAPEGPFGDHTGYYNDIEEFPVFTVTHMTRRADPIYHATYTGRPPDEPSVLSSALNELYVPILRRQFPEIVDFCLPPEACSYRIACVSIRKAYPGHARQIMCGIWGTLRQFLYTKMIIVTDDDVDVRDWKDVMWALSTRVDPRRDSLIMDNTPIDSLDFASPVPGLGSKLGFDATRKWPGESDRTWGRTIRKDPEVVRRIEQLWPSLGLD